MSIYKEPPPGMFVVPDPQDMTKVKHHAPLGEDIHIIVPLTFVIKSVLCSDKLWALQPVQ